MLEDPLVFVSSARNELAAGWRRAATSGVTPRVTPEVTPEVTGEVTPEVAGEVTEEVTGEVAPVDGIRTNREDALATLLATIRREPPRFVDSEA